mgnify:CR=1 FL=1
MQERTAEELAALYRDVFEDDRRGAAILDDLIGRFTKAAITQGGIDAVLQTYRNAGMRAVLDYVIGRINAANGAPPLQQEEEPQA